MAWIVVTTNQMFGHCQLSKYLIDHNVLCDLILSLMQVKSEEDKVKLSLRPVAERLSELLENQ